jgi:hypothetical protein
MAGVSGCLHIDIDIDAGTGKGCKNGVKRGDDVHARRYIEHKLAEPL